MMGNGATMMTQWEYQNKLEQYGFPYINSGAFSSVYSAGPHKVIKVSRDTAWLAWIIWANQEPNRLLYAPKLYSVKWHGQGDDRFYVALIERIAKTAREAGCGDFLDDSKHWTNGAQWFVREARAVGFGMGDLHRGNWGFRFDGSLVIIDPTTSCSEKLERRCSKARIKSRAAA